MINPGDSFQFLEASGALRLTLLVLEVLSTIDRGHLFCLQARVLVLDATELAKDFRAQPGEVTDWWFEEGSVEWDSCLRRVA